MIGRSTERTRGNARPLFARRRWWLPLLVLLLALQVLLAGAGTARLYIIWDEEGGTDLFWNRTSATVFMPRSRVGWSGNYLQYGWQYFRAWMRASIEGTESVHWLTTFTINPGDAANPVIERTSPRDFFPWGVLDDEIVGTSEHAEYRWDGQQLVPLTDVAARHFSATNLLSHSGDTTPTGWQRERSVLRDGESVYTLQLQGATVELIARCSGWDDKKLLIRLPGQEPRQIWSLDQNPRYVTAAEYTRLMTSP